MDNSICDGVVGRDFYVNPSTGQKKCCQPLCDRNEKACVNRCPSFIHSTTEVLTTLSPAAFVENEGISTELVIILIVSLSVLIIALSLCVAWKHKEIYKFITNLWGEIRTTTPGVPPSDSNQEEICLINIDPLPLNPGAPGFDPSVSVAGPLTPENDPGTEDSHDTDITDTASVNNDHASTNLGRPGVTKDVDSLQNDEAVAREYQSEEDGISANAKRNKDNEQTRVKKQVGMQLGGTKPLDGEDEVTYTDTDQPGRSSTTLGSSSEKTLQTNQSTNQFPEYSCPLSNKNNPVSTHSNETGLAHSTMTEEQRRRDTNPPSDTSTVAQDTEDGFKQTENVLNGQTPFSNVIS
ncbi:uncharacterized protein LOC128205121 [Mya arenaria]|uniref:uncharacterized protein LOC128205121 n=1 Tax=Mya arenaria TaxID=6604 RepID=UPI0022E7BA72|nr:uncharacterized protein LOC128205121 [Mya arenaria]